MLSFMKRPWFISIQNMKHFKKSDKSNCPTRKYRIRRPKHDGLTGYPCFSVCLALDQKLEEMLRDAKEKRWKEENRDAIEAFNHRIEEKGVFSDGKSAF